MFPNMAFSTCATLVVQRDGLGGVSLDNPECIREHFELLVTFLIYASVKLSCVSGGQGGGPNWLGIPRL